MSRGNRGARQRWTIGGALVSKSAELPHPDPDLEDPKRMERLLAKAGLLIATAFRQIRTEKRNAELERVRNINAPRPTGPDGEDHGMDLGPAALARPSTLARVGGRLGGAAQRDATPIVAKRVGGTTLFERLSDAAQISDRQAAAGKRLWLLKWAAKIDQRVTADYGAVPEDVEQPPEDGIEELEAICPDGYDPRTYHRWVLRQVPAQMAMLLEMACDGRHPGVRYLATLQEALTMLADLWGIDE